MALFAESMWARDAGYDRCLVHFLTASRAVDERAVWANERT